MDELMMNMFSLIAEQVRNRQELFDEEGKIMQALLNGGYHLHEADAAITLMQTLVQKEAESFFGRGQVLHPHRFRTMTREERDRFTTDAFSFLIKLAHLGIISEDQREELFDKAMNMYTAPAASISISSSRSSLLFCSPAPRSASTRRSPTLGG